MSLQAKATLDTALLLFFALPHSLLLTKRGYAAVERVVPKELFYTAYGLVSSLSLLVVFALWQPLPGELWHTEGPAAWALLGANGLAWGLMGLSLFHYGMLRQPGIAHWWAYLHGRKVPGPALPKTGPFKRVRHPIYLAMFLMMWVAPTMTTGHLLTALVWTGYLVAGALHKEVRLKRALGAAWERYAEAVPALPLLGWTRRRA